MHFEQVDTFRLFDPASTVLEVVDLHSHLVGQVVGIANRSCLKLLLWAVVETIKH